METTVTFEGGMNKDIEPSRRKEGSYFDSWAGTLISMGNNSYAWENERGNKIFFTLRNNSKIVTSAYSSKTDRLYVLIYKDIPSISGESEMEVGYFYNWQTDGSSASYKILYAYRDNVSNTQGYVLDGRLLKSFVIYENDCVERFYWGGDDNPPMVLNGLQKEITTDILTGSIVAGVKYMVVDGTVLYNAVVYGINATTGDMPSVKNVFTGVIGQTGFTTVTGTPRVIKYVDIDTLRWNARVTFSGVDFVSMQDGNVPCGTFQVCYRLKTKDGAQTGFSPKSGLFTAYRQGNVAVSGVLADALNPYISYQKATGDGENGTIESSGRSFNFNVPFIDTRFDFIEVVVINYSAKDVIRDIRIIRQEEINKTVGQYSFRYYGNETLGSLAIEDIIFNDTVLLKVKDLIPNKNRNIVVNTSESSDVDLGHFSGVTSAVNVVKALTDSLYSYAPQTSDVLYAPLAAHKLIDDPSVGNVISAAEARIEPEQWYYVTNGTLTYNAVMYGVGEVAGRYFKGVIGGSTKREFSGTGTAIPVLRLKSYINASSVQIYRHIPLPDYYDYKSTIMSAYGKTFMRGETYRVGIMLYDLVGQPMFVRWAKDVTIDECKDSPIVSYTGRNAGDAATIGFRYTHLNLLAIELNNINLTDIIDKISGFSIVICPRDKQRLRQGIVWPVALEKSLPLADVPISYKFRIHQISHINYAEDDYYNLKITPNATTDNEALYKSGAFYCPDELFGITEAGSFDSSDQVEIADYLYDIALADLATDFAAIAATHEDFAQTVKNAVASANPYYKLNYASAGGTGALAKGSKGNILASTAVAAGVGAGVPAETVPVGEGDSAYSADVRMRAGGLAPLAYGKTNDFTYLRTDVRLYSAPVLGATTPVDQNQKTLLNIIRPKAASSLYGGTSDAAKSSNTYVSTGHYQKVDADFKTAIKTVVADVDTYIVNGVEFMGGDTFINYFDYCRVLRDELDEEVNDTTPANPGDPNYSDVIIFPVESEHNYNYRQGRHAAKDLVNDYNRTDVKNYFPNGIVWQTAGSTADVVYYQPEEFIYNLAYSTQGLLFQFPALPVNFDYDCVGKFPSRGRYSDLKFYGEAIDSYRVFKTLNSQDADILMGEINCIDVGIDRLFYWQSNGVGYFPISERTQFALGSAAPVQMGVGGIMDRFDSINKTFGCKHPFSLVKGENYWKWFDINNKCVVKMDFGGALSPESVVLGMQGYFNEFFNVVNDYSDSLFSQKIIAGYDAKYKRILMTFNSVHLMPVNNSLVTGALVPMGILVRDVDSDDTYECIIPFAYDGVKPSANTVNWELTEKTHDKITLSISEQLGKFISFHWYTPTIYIKKQNYLFTMSDQAELPNKIYQQNTGNMQEWYGSVYPAYLEPIVNIPGEEEVAVYDNCILKGNELFFDDVVYSTNINKSSDKSITVRNRDYVGRDGNWYFSVPKDRRGRVMGMYLKLSFKFKGINSLSAVLNKLLKVISLKVSTRSQR